MWQQSMYPVSKPIKELQKPRLCGLSAERQTHRSMEQNEEPRNGPNEYAPPTVD